MYQSEVHGVAVEAAPVSDPNRQTFGVQTGDILPLIVQRPERKCDQSARLRPMQLNG